MTFLAASQIALRAESAVVLRASSRVASSTAAMFAWSSRVARACRRSSASSRCPRNPSTAAIAVHTKAVRHAWSG